MLYLNLKYFKHWICKIESSFLPNRFNQPKQILMNKLIDINAYEHQAVCLAVKLIIDGSVIALPTDTVYGLAADAQNPSAIGKLYNIKGRNLQKPIAICTHNVNDIGNWGKIGHLPSGLLDALLPGPVTVVLQRTPSLNCALNPEESNIAIRVPNSGFVLSIVNSLKKPIALTSANESNKPSTLKPIEFSTLWPKLDAIFDGGTIGCLLESRQGSTIVDLTVNNHYSILRTGTIIINKESKDGFFKASIVHHFEKTLNEFHLEFPDTEVKVTSSNRTANKLLDNLEALFLHGLKETFISQLSTVIGNNVDKNVDINFWHCLLVLSPSGIVDQINSLKQITTDIGRCRAWIRCTLNDSVFRSYLISAVKHRQCVIKYYNKTAILRDRAHIEKIIALLESIDMYQFDLTLNSSLLNTWTNSALMLAGYVTPALKQNPLHINTLQVGEEVNSIDEAIVINDKSDESFSSSISSSFNDLDNFHKLNFNEEDMWKKIFSQPSTSSTILENIKDFSYDSYDTEEKKEISDTEVEQCKPNDIVTEEGKEENTSKTLNTETKNEPGEKSFAELLESYNSRYKSNIEHFNRQISDPKLSNNKPFDDSKMSDSDDDYEKVAVHPESLSLDLLKEYLKYLFTPPTESGLHTQEYTCKSCNEIIGIDFGDYLKCNFTACYYCVHCFGSEKWPIPVKVLFDWDYNQYPVSKSSATFLSEVQYHPLFNMRSIHHKLYKANNEMKKSKNLRWKIYYLYHYLSTCKFYNIEDLSKTIWPRFYFFNNIHLYSFADLQEIYSGTLFEFLNRIIETCRIHVYQCTVCSQKGFICEICRDSKIIYPFDLDVNYRCRRCRSVFHRNCFTGTTLCPKCERDKARKMKETQNIDILDD